MKAIKMTFKEMMFDEEGNPMRNKKTGEIMYKRVQHVVRHNIAYFPYKL